MKSERSEVVVREIKFRAWDKTYTKGEMIVDVSVASVGWIAHDGRYARDNEAVMQYTGLKDKNGKEIYEGDIVILSPAGSPQLVEWSDFHTGFVFRRGDTTTAIPSIYSREVIGNIYENKELIKKE